MDGSDVVVWASAIAVHIGAFIAPHYLSKPCLATKHLNFETYTGLTRLKFQTNFVFVVFGYLLGVELDPTAISLLDLAGLFLSFSTFFYGGGIYPLNGISDLEDDRLKKPTRPMPAGKISSAHALAFAAVNLLLGFASAYHLRGMALVRVYAWFLGINTMYSWFLRGLSIKFALPFITCTGPLRMYMGAVVAQASKLPTAIYTSAYLLYVAIHFTRKVIIQSGTEMSRSWLLVYLVLAAALLSPLELATTTSHMVYAAAFVLCSLNYVVAAFIPAMRVFLSGQYAT
jgi:hypothetical protein